MAYTDEEVIYLNAALSLLGMGLEHHAAVKGIKTDADVARDELRFKIKDTQQKNDIAIEKISMDLALKQIDDLDRQLETAENTFYDTTHKRFEYADEDVTKVGKQLADTQKKSQVDKITQMRLDSQSQVEARKARLKEIRKEQHTITPVIDYIIRNYSGSAAGDKFYTPEDYKATVTLALEAFDIDNPSIYLKEAAILNEPNQLKLESLNEKILNINESGKRFEYQRSNVTLNARKEAEVHIISMGTSLLPADDGTVTATMAELDLKLEESKKKGQALYGKTITNDADMQNVKDDLVSAVKTGDMWVLEGMIRDFPWIEEAIQDLMPELWVAYANKKQRWRDISVSAPSKIHTSSGGGGGNNISGNAEAAAARAIKAAFGEDYE